jgi:hypothetical protein
MDAKRVAVLMVFVLGVYEIVHHDGERVPHTEHAPAPIFMPKPIPIVTSAERLARNPKELFAKFRTDLTQTSAKGIFSLA